MNNGKLIKENLMESEIRDLTIYEVDEVSGAAWADWFGGTDEVAEAAMVLEIARNNVLGSTSKF